MGPGLDILAVRSVLPCFLAGFSDLGVEAQAVEHAVALIALVQGIKVELGGAETRVCALTEDGHHLRLKIGAHSILGLVGGIVGIPRIEDRLKPFDRCIPGDDVAILE